MGRRGWSRIADREPFRSGGLHDTQELRTGYMAITGSESYANLHDQLLS
ncbi:MAG: hypothetical protein LBV60_19140 [Streptomyces sp.]|nr:hypothetical protein [Streptomyces sp.]